METNMVVEERTKETLHQNLQEEPSIDTDKLSYEIFSILESKFLFGYDDANATNNNSSFLLPTTIPSSSPLRVKTTQRGKVCILSIDGAGMRGLFVGKALSYLERSLRNISGNPDARISDYFDLGAGTGTGGIFTAMLFSSSPSDGSSSRLPVYHADDTWRFLAENGGRSFSVKKKGRQNNQRKSLFQCIFGGRRKGVTATVEMERSLKETFGEDMTLRDTVRPVLIPCYDLRSSAPFVFSRADALEAESFDFRLWEVCRATSAELGRFEPVELRSVDGTTCCVGVDGGVAMSNPTAAAITHVLHNKQEFPFVRGVEDLLVLSLGAAGGATAVFGNEDLEYEKVRRWKEEDWARPISQISSDGAADLVDHAVAMAFSHCPGCSNYVRIQANLGADVDGEDTSDGNVKRLLGHAEEMLKQKNVESVMFGGMKKAGESTNSDKLDWFARELVLEHQSRSNRIAPTVALKQKTPPAAPEHS